MYTPKTPYYTIQYNTDSVINMVSVVGTKVSLVIENSLVTTVSFSR